MWLDRAGSVACGHRKPGQQALPALKCLLPRYAGPQGSGAASGRGQPHSTALEYLPIWWWFALSGLLPKIGDWEVALSCLQQQRGRPRMALRQGEAVVPLRLLLNGRRCMGCGGRRRVLAAGPGLVPESGWRGFGVLRNPDSLHLF